MKITSSRRSFIKLFANTLVSASLCLAGNQVAQAGDRCCAHCGCKEQVTKVCRIVREDKKITTTCWGVQEEEFCIGDPSCPDQEHCETVCKKNPDDKLDAKVCSSNKALKWTSWIPGSCATVFTKSKLMKKTVTKSVPSYKWVLEDVCAACKANGAADSKEPASKEAESGKK